MMDSPLGFPDTVLRALAFCHKRMIWNCFLLLKVSTSRAGTGLDLSFIPRC